MELTFVLALLAPQQFEAAQVVRRPMSLRFPIMLRRVPGRSISGGWEGEVTRRPSDDSGGDFPFVFATQSHLRGERWLTVEL